jgi:hypothetical protein
MTSWGIPRGQSVLYIVGESLLGWDTPGTWSHRIDEPRRNYKGLFSCGFLLIVLPRIAMIDPFFNRTKSSEESVASFTTDSLSKRRDCIVASKAIVSDCGKGLDESGVVARVEGIAKERKCPLFSLLERSQLPPNSIPYPFRTFVKRQGPDIFLLIRSWEEWLPRNAIG